MIVASHPKEPVGKSFARLLLKLHCLIAQGKGDNDEADAVRTEMEAHWRGMNPDEQARFTELSGDLYALQEGKDNATVALSDRQEWLAKFREAFQCADADAMLALLRQTPHDFPHELISFLQASSWEKLGYRDVALYFIKDRQCSNHSIELLEKSNAVGRQ
jgi:hypothetical protein